MEKLHYHIVITLTYSILTDRIIFYRSPTEPSYNYTKVTILSATSNSDTTNIFNSNDTIASLKINRIILFHLCSSLAKPSHDSVLEHGIFDPLCLAQTCKSTSQPEEYTLGVCSCSKDQRIPIVAPSSTWISPSLRPLIGHVSPSSS